MLIIVKSDLLKVSEYSLKEAILNNIANLKKDHTGQIMTYMNYIDKNIKNIEENDTVGIICK